MCKHNIEIMTKVAKKSLGKELRNSQGLRKVVAIYNTKKANSLQKVPNTLLKK